MTWHAFASLALFAAVVTVIPGPDFAVVLRNALVGRSTARSFPSSCLRAPPPIEAVGLAPVHAAISVVFLIVVTLTAHAARRVLHRRRVRRAVDTITGTAMLGFGARLAFEHA